MDLFYFFCWIIIFQVETLRLGSRQRCGFLPPRKIWGRSGGLCDTVSSHRHLENNESKGRQDRPCWSRMISGGARRRRRFTVTRASLGTPNVNFPYRLDTQIVYSNGCAAAKHGVHFDGAAICRSPNYDPTYALTDLLCMVNLPDPIIHVCSLTGK